MSELLLKHFDLLAQAPDGVARLRELILTLAVQGKLVPQAPTDEPASLLLQRIRAEKDRLIAEGKIKRDKPLPAITEEEIPFDLPTGWEWVRLADIVRVLNGRAYNKQELLESGPMPVLRVGNFFTSNHWYYSDLVLEPEKYCHAGDLLYAWSASFGPFIWGGPTAIYHYHIWKLEPWARADFDSGFLHRFLEEKTAEIKAGGHGISMVHMTKEKMEKIVVPYPPLSEQARIVARVEELMRLCDALEAKQQLDTTQHAQLVQTLLGTLTDSTTPEELATAWQRVATYFDLLLDRPEAVDALEQTILQLAVRGLLVPQDPTDEPARVLLQRIRAEKDRLIAEGKIKRGKPLPPVTDEEKPFELPRGWNWVPLQHVGFTQTGTTPDKKNPQFYGTDIPFIKPGDIYHDRIDYENEGLTNLGLADSGRLAPAGSVLMVCIGTIGKSNLCLRDCSFNQQINSVTPLCCSPEYINLYLRSPTFQSEAWAQSSSTTISILNKGKWEAIPVALPPLQEQLRIVARVEELRQLCKNLRQRLTATGSTQAHLAVALVEAVATA